MSKICDRYRCTNMWVSCSWRLNDWCHYGHRGRCAFCDGGAGARGNGVMGNGGAGMRLPVKVERQPKEQPWKCKYCDSLVKRKLLKCPNCGAQRKENAQNV